MFSLRKLVGEIYMGTMALDIFNAQVFFFNRKPYFFVFANQCSRDFTETIILMNSLESILIYAKQTLGITL